MLGVDIQAARAADNQKAGLRTAENVAKMLQRRTVLRESVLRPGAEGVDYRIEALQVVGGEVEKLPFFNTCFASV